MKPHGALYNSAVANEQLSNAIAEGVARWSKDLILMGLAGSLMLEVFQGPGFQVEAEAFADRVYELDGSAPFAKVPGLAYHKSRSCGGTSLHHCRIWLCGHREWADDSDQSRDDLHP